MVPAGVLRDPARLGQHVAVEEEEDVVSRRPRPGVPRPGDSETPALLTHHPDVQRDRPWRFQGRLGPVVDDYHLEQIPRIGLALERRQRPPQRVGGGLPGWDDHADRQGGCEAVRRLHRHLAPVVVPDGGWSGRHPEPANSLWTRRPAWESVLEEMGNPIVRAGAGRFPHRIAARIACAIRSALFRGEGGPSPHPSPAAQEGLSAQPAIA